MDFVILVHFEKSTQDGGQQMDLVFGVGQNHYFVCWTECLQVEVQHDLGNFVRPLDLLGEEDETEEFVDEAAFQTHDIVDFKVASAFIQVFFQNFLSI